MGQKLGGQLPLPDLGLGLAVYSTGSIKYLYSTFILPLWYQMAYYLVFTIIFT
jgi:hypothetical protein